MVIFAAAMRATLSAEEDFPFWTRERKRERESSNQVGNKRIVAIVSFLLRLLRNYCSGMPPQFLLLSEEEEHFGDPKFQPDA